MIRKDSRLYLAHSVELINSVRRWELYIQGRYMIDLINPFIGNSFERVEDLKELTTRTKILAYMRQMTSETCSGIVKYDLRLLRGCDGLVAVFNSPSVGTSQEIFAAAYMYRMPVFIISRRYVAHPWIRKMAKMSGGKIFTSRKAFEEYLQSTGLKKI